MPVRELSEWYTLVRFNESPKDLTGVAQTRSAAEALTLLLEWDDRYPADTTCVFDPANMPLARVDLARYVERRTATSDGAISPPMPAGRRV